MYLILLNFLENKNKKLFVLYCIYDVMLLDVLFVSDVIANAAEIAINLHTTPQLFFFLTTLYLPQIKMVTSWELYRYNATINLYTEKQNI